jgi:hypothetical protein
MFKCRSRTRSRTKRNGKNKMLSYFPLEMFGEMGHTEDNMPHVQKLID